MDNPDQSVAVSGVIRILRKITRVIQIAPFVYLLLFSLYLITESFLPEWALRIADATFNVPIYATAGMLGIGRILKLCPWFKTAVLLPGATKIEGYIDAFIYTFTQNEIIITNTAIGISFLLFIYLTFHHFFHGREENPHGNPRLLPV